MDKTPAYQIRYRNTDLMVVGLRRTEPVRITYREAKYLAREEALTYTTKAEAEAAMKVCDLLGANMHEIVLEK